VLTGTVTVEQNVILQEGASLSVNLPAGGATFTVNGNLQGGSVSGVRLTTGLTSTITIHGNVSITGATGEVLLDHVIIGGNLNISDSTASSIQVSLSQVTGHALFQNKHGHERVHWREYDCR
jgi:hypothetical protein